jgi:serine/threonine protein kinase
MEGLNYLHSSGTAHRDLKPENLMLDTNFNLKIADFGFAAPVQGRDGSGMLETQLGTASYMAPEIHLGKAYSGPSVDLFASAIILFVILTQRPPFSSANPQDPHYRLLAANRAEIFWQAHKDAEEGEDIYSAEFKDLFEKMMAINPAQRPKLEEIMAHPWMQGQYASEEEVVEEFKRRKAIVDEEAHNERENKRKQRNENNNQRVRRGAEKKEDGALDKEEQQENLNQLRAQFEDYELGDYDAEIWKKTSFFTTGNHVDLFLEIQDYLEALGIPPTISDSRFKIKFNATQHQAQKISALYINKVNEMQESIRTEAQTALLARPEAQAVLQGNQEEVKEDGDAQATCIIELLGVKKLEAADDEDQKRIACCVDFSYKDKSAKKLDVEKQYVSHFKAWKALLNPWVNMASSEI